MDNHMGHWQPGELSARPGYNKYLEGYDVPRSGPEPGNKSLNAGLPGLAKTIWRAGMSSRHAGRSSGTSDIYATICHGGHRQGTTAPSHNRGAEDNIGASSQEQLTTDQAKRVVRD